jgi:hypothetical protein
MNVTIKHDGEGLCRQIYHVDVHDPKSAKVFCNICDSHVKEDNNNPKNCQCCGNKIFKKKEYKLLRIMLNNAIDSYETLIISFISKPTKGRVIVSQKWKSITYELPLDVLSLYYDMREPASGQERKNGLPKWANQFYDKKHIEQIHEKGLLEFIDKRTKAAWLG